ncbi:Smr/MutS family protein, partial [Bacteroidales bacterium OttesenSCG-928-C03]|nr:Smr/MutS family protein [Bacteroidales bacterium OttesenSCG-928-C03]
AQAKNQATSIIDGANKLIENTIREIKEAQAETEKTREIRKEVAEKKEAIKQQSLPKSTMELPKPISVKKRISPKQKQETIEDAKIKVGDSVFMTDTQTMGEVLSLNGRDITIGFSSISLRTTIDKVVKISKKEARMASRGSKMNGSTISEVMNRKVAQFNPTLDLRGYRADEAVAELEEYIDEASLLGIKQVKILHGKGNGILRHVVRQALGKRKEVRTFRDEVLELGGSGITVAEL